MSIIKVRSHQIGIDATAANNFSFEVPTVPDGTMKLARGNSTATTQNIFSIAANGTTTFNQPVTMQQAFVPFYPTSFKNIIHNGNMSVAERGGTTVAINNFICDRWSIQASASYPAQGIFASDYSLSNEGAYHISAFATSAAGAPAGGTYCILQQGIEGATMRNLLWGTAKAKTVSLRFRAASSAASFVMSVAVRNYSGARSYVVPITITPTATDYSITIPGDTSGTWPTDNTLCATVSFAFACGSTYSTATSGAWVATNSLAHNTQSNGNATNGAFISVTDVQLEVGPVSTPYEVHPIEHDAEICRRYYQRIRPYGMMGVSYTPNGDTRLMFNLYKNMRTNPSVTLSTNNLSVIAVGDQGTVVNVIISIFVAGYTDRSLSFSLSSYSALAPCGAVCVWGAPTTIDIFCSADF